MSCSMAKTLELRHVVYTTFGALVFENIGMNSSRPLVGDLRSDRNRLIYTSDFRIMRYYS